MKDGHEYEFLVVLMYVSGISGQRAKIEFTGRKTHRLSMQRQRAILVQKTEERHLKLTS